MADRRTPLGREFRLAGRSYVFLTADAVEVDDLDGFDVVRTRVLLDDVMQLTLHKRPPWGLFWTVLLVMAFITLLIGIFPASARGTVMLYVGPVFAVSLAANVVRVVFGVHYVTVFGRRSKARVAFYVRGRKAREVFSLLLQRITQRQTLVPAATAEGPQAAAEPGP
jgi:hypothetical protein